MPTWDAAQYLRYSDARTRPARDLLARVPLTLPARVVDVGCGPGNSTALLVERWPRAAVVGIDSSPEMLEEARTALPAVDFQWADLTEWAPTQPVDLVFSNATLQWVDDHAAVLDRLLGWLAPGGVLAVQMPSNFDAASHVLLRRLAAEGPWRARLEGVLRQNPVSAPEEYHRMVAAPGRRVDIWTTEYLQVLEGERPVLEWVRGTALRPVLERLPPTQTEDFLSAYAAALDEAYPPQPDGTTLFPFRRLFMVVSG